MKASKVTLLDAARDFQFHELFFSTTDRKGVIRSGNDVFVRVSGYDEPALLGQPHNLIRHPDMPRAVFRLIWDYLGRGHGVAGYVKNLAADGRHYWVVAVITPLADGYLSVRFKPTSRLHGTVQALYREMTRIEQESAARGEPGSAGMDLSSAHLTTALAGAGFADYDAFMSAMLVEELGSRDAAVAIRSVPLIPPRLSGSASRRIPRLESIYQTALSTYRELNVLHGSLGDYLSLERELRAGFAQLEDLARNVSFIAINATIKATQLGNQGRCTAVVADFLGLTSGGITALSTAFAQHMLPITRALRTAVFNLAAARLELEMMLVFSHEVASLGQVHASHGRNLRQLESAFGHCLKPAMESLHAIATATRGFRGHSEDFAKLTLYLKVAQTTGATEASRLTGDETLQQTFRDLQELTYRCRAETDRLDTIIMRFDAFAASTPSIIRQLTSVADANRAGMKEFIDLLAGLDDPPPDLPGRVISAPSALPAGCPVPAFAVVP